MTGRSRRTAVLGGDGRQRARWGAPEEIVFFASPRDGGNGELRRLVAAIRAGSIQRVLVLTRWNSHAGMARLRRICRDRGVAMEFVR